MQRTVLLEANRWTVGADARTVETRDSSITPRVQLQTAIVAVRAQTLRIAAHRFDSARVRVYA